MGISIRAYAKYRDVSQSAVQKAIKTGRITKETDGTIDPNKADKDWDNNTKKNVTTLINNSDSISKDERERYDDIVIARKFMKAKITRIKLQQDRNEIASFEDANKHVGDIAIHWRNGFETLPARMASLFAAGLEADEHSCFVALDDLIRDELQQQADKAQLTPPNLQRCYIDRFRPPDYVSLSDWADNNHRLSSTSSAEPGLWRTSRTPYLKEIMDNLTAKSPVQRIVLMKGAQLGGTEMGLCWFGYVAIKDPGTFMMVEPTVDTAKRHSRLRIESQIDIMPELRELIPPARERDSGNTVMNKKFPGGTLVLTGANSAASLRSTPARYIFMDEVDAYPVDVDGEGDPIALMERRAATFSHRRKLLLLSTPTLESTSRIAREFEQAKDNPSVMKTFVNTMLGEPFAEGFEAPEWEHLYERREDYPMGTIPEGGLFLTAGVDVQRDRIECEVVAWGRDKISWSVDYVVLDGDTAQPKVWRKLTKLLSEDWQHAWGLTLPIRVMCIDSGYATQTVYDWVKNHPQASWGASGARASQPRTVVAIKGSAAETSFILKVSKTHLGGKKRGLKLWNISSSIGKEELYRWLNLPRLTDEDLAKGKAYLPGTCHFPQHGEEYFKQLTAERRVITSHKGFPKVSWVKDPSRNNEVLDCRVYARAAASIFGIDRFQEKDWQKLEKALGDKPAKLCKPVKRKKTLSAAALRQPKPTKFDMSFLNKNWLE